MQTELEAYEDELEQEERRLESQLRAPYDGRLGSNVVEWMDSMRRRRARIDELRGVCAAMREQTA